MELIKAGLKQTVERCKKIARSEGLVFRDETLEFIVTNDDLIRLSPKGMIPTLYDYWVNDVFVLKDKGKYDLYPHNPYETVINTRPPLSFYNDNNPDWLNVMIFYHVIGHIDFFQNNTMFAKTWLDDFLGQARAQAEVIRELRYEHGRYLDYVIEFSRNMDNLVNFHAHLAASDETEISTDKVDWFFDTYLQEIIKVNTFRYIEELQRMNEMINEQGREIGRHQFLDHIQRKYIDFTLKFERRKQEKTFSTSDVMEYIIDHSEKLKHPENEWMKSVMKIVRDTALYFQPQIRTKILNEGWASYWHEKLFMADPVLRGNEIAFSKINAGVVSLPRVGLNPYAVGLRMFKYLEAKADRGMLSFDYEKLHLQKKRNDFDQNTGKGLDYIFEVRRYYNDLTAINTFVDQDFVDEFKLFVTGKRLNMQRQSWEYFVKSRRASEYQRLLHNSLYHPPAITVDHQQTTHNGILHLIHRHEGKELVREYVQSTMMGIEYLWGAPVVLDTSEIDDEALQKMSPQDMEKAMSAPEDVEFSFRKVRYTMKDRKLTKEIVKK